MELNYDWKSFQTLFYTKRKISASDLARPVYLIADKKVVVSLFCDGEDLSDWIGEKADDVMEEFANRELILYDRCKVDEWMNNSMGVGHFYDQIQFLRTEAKPDLVSKSRFKVNDPIIKRHFLLHAVQTWWRKLLPTTYGIYVRLEGGGPDTSLFLIVQRGRLDSFHVPDLSSMIPDRRKQNGDVVKYLSEHYLIPVQGLFLTHAEWQEWSELENPWPQILTALKTNRAKMAPFKWGLASLIASRAYFGI